MTRVLLTVVLPLVLLFGCSQQEGYETIEVSSFIDKLKDNGVDGTTGLREVDNDDIEYVVTYVIAQYTSTRVLSFFKCTDEQAARKHLAKAMENPKLSGQARNGDVILAATFYPPDEEAVARIRELFLAHEWD